MDIFGAKRDNFQRQANKIFASSDVVPSSMNHKNCPKYLLDYVRNYVVDDACEF